MIRFLLFLWQLPQDLVGFVWTRFMEKKNINGITVYFGKCFKCGVSLGDYIILDNVYKETTKKHLLKTVKHEYGHSKQSRVFGLFYLLFVGLPSVIGNITDRMFHGDWSIAQREKWYYSRYPEKWADKLGGVVRFTS